MAIIIKAISMVALLMRFVSHEYNNIQLIDNSSVVSVYGKRIMTPYLDFNNNVFLRTENLRRRRIYQTRVLTSYLLTCLSPTIMYLKTKNEWWLHSFSLFKINSYTNCFRHYHSKSSTLTLPITYLGAHMH